MDDMKKTHLEKVVPLNPANKANDARLIVIVHGYTVCTLSKSIPKLRHQECECVCTAPGTT